MKESMNSTRVTSNIQHSTRNTSVDLVGAGKGRGGSNSTWRTVPRKSGSACKLLTAAALKEYPVEELDSPLTVISKNGDLTDDELARQFVETTRQCLRAFDITDTSIKKAKSITFEISESEKVVAFIRMRLTLMYKNNDKKVAKSWIKAICRKKQSLFPYHDRKKLKLDGQPCEVPRWWPDTRLCIFSEPDHIVKAQRVVLLVHLLRLRPTAGELYEWNKRKLSPDPVHVEEGWTIFLRKHAPPEILNSPDSPEEVSRQYVGYLRDIYKVAELEEAFERNCIDGSTTFQWTLRPDELANLLRPASKKRTRSQDSDTLETGIASRVSCGLSKKIKTESEAIKSLPISPQPKKAFSSLQRSPEVAVVDLDDRASLITSTGANGSLGIRDEEITRFPTKSWFHTPDVSSHTTTYNQSHDFKSYRDQSIDTTTRTLLPAFSPSVNFATAIEMQRTHNMLLPRVQPLNPIEPNDFDQTGYYHSYNIPFNACLSTPSEPIIVAPQDTQISGHSAHWNSSYFDHKSYVPAVPITPPMSAHSSFSPQTYDITPVSCSCIASQYRPHLGQTDDHIPQAYNNSSLRMYKEPAALPSAVERGFTGHGSGVGGGAAT